VAYLSDIPSSSTFVPYTGATSTVNLGSQNLYTNGNIAVGTTINNAKVYIVGSTGQGGLGFAINTLNWGMAFISTVAIDTAIAPYEGDMLFSAAYWDGSTYSFPERVRIAAHTGNLGINTTTPTQKLHVDGNARITGAIYDSSNTPGTSDQILSSTGTGITWIANAKPSYMMTGVFSNMFGGDPGGLNKDILEWSPTTPAASHSSVLPILQNCRITAAGFKWISSTVMGTINPGDSWTVNLYKMTNPLTGSTTADGNFTLVGSLNITLTSANSGTTPGIFSSGLNLILNAGDIIRIAGNETGTIGTSTEEAQLTVLFEVI
jgi:hypothetical protein